MSVHDRQCACSCSDLMMCGSAKWSQFGVWCISGRRSSRIWRRSSTGMPRREASCGSPGVALISCV